MDLSTNYMGIRLKNPIVPSASPLSKSVDTVKKLEDAGASAVVVYSLFEEQITHESNELDHYLSYGTESYAESLSYFPAIEDFNYGPDEYLEHIRKIKKAVGIPIFGSLNGISSGGWMKYAKLIEDQDRLYALGLWSRRYFSATVDQFLGFIEHSYTGLCLLPALADSAVNVDMIVQNISEEGFTDMTFSCPTNQIKRAEKAIADAHAKGTFDYSELVVDDAVAKISVVGIGMRSHTGVAAQMFAALAAENINIKVITTSEIKISVLIDRKYMELAVQALHDAFQLEKAS